ncbi:MAG: site-specific integrase [Brooklawnia sp.]|nr:site-specific integrase [Brooklawnia sp.]
MKRRSFGHTPRTRNGRYQARYTGPDGVMHTAGMTFAVKMDAEGWLANEDRLIARGEWTPPAQRRAEQAAQAVASVLTLRVYADRVLDERSTRNRNPLRPSTRDFYDKCLRLVILPVLGDVPVAALTPAMIRQWHSDLNPATPTQNGNAYNLLSSILKDAVDEGLLGSNPCRLKGAGKPAPARAGVALTLEQLAAYLAALPERYKLLLSIAALGALRSGEARALRRCDVDLKTGVVHVRQGVTRVREGKGWRWHIGPPKTSAGVRDVYLPTALLPDLRVLLAALPAGRSDELLFKATNGDPLNGSVIRDAHKTALAAAGLPADIQLHDLRRTALTLASEGGATTAELQRMAGHTTPNMAMHYQRPTLVRDQARAERLGAALAGHLTGSE